MSEPRSSSVGLRASVMQANDRLTLAYELHNGLAEPIYFYAVPVDAVENRLRRGEAYIGYDPVNALLEATLIVPPPPPLLNFFQTPVSLCRRAEPGESARGEIVLAVPVEPWGPYPEEEMGLEDDEIRDLDASDIEFPPARSIRFVTGFFQESLLVESRPGPDPDTYWCQGEGFRVLSAAVVLEEPVPIKNPFL